MTRPSPTHARDWLHALDALLVAQQALWQPQPFKQARPSWCASYPLLAEALLGLDDAMLDQLSDDDAALRVFLARYVPIVDELARLVCLPRWACQPLAPYSAHLTWDVPGRKWAQIEAFAGTIGELKAPLLEWCGGKGHLGRLLASQWAVPALTLEVNPTLCEAGDQLARRARVAQSFAVTDVLLPDAAQHLPGRHAVALHACGELHRTLIRRAVAARVSALDIAPCCYHLGMSESYRAFTDGLQLLPSADDLRLAVTETVTSRPREVRQRDLEMAWKLGFDQLRRDLARCDEYWPLRSIDKGWLALGFAGFCQQLAAREAVTLPVVVDWAHWEAVGWQRQREVMRLSLLRKAFRRALELWLVLDMAVYLEQHGYIVSLREFCHRSLTPRNVLLSARRL